MAHGPLQEAAPVSAAALTTATSPLATGAAVTALAASVAAINTGDRITRRINVSLARAAGTYDIAVATTGDMWVEIDAAQVTTAAAGLVSALIATDHSVLKSIVASTLLASLTADALLAVVTPKFILPVGKKLVVTIVGTGSAGNVALIVRTSPLSAGATLV